MSDTKLRPEDLTATVREMYPPPPPLAGWLGFYYDSGFYDSEQGKREDAGWYCSGKVHADREEALCELAGFRPFEGSAIVEVNRALFAPAPEKAAKVETMADRIAADLKAGTFRGEQPAPAEPAVIRQSTTDAGEPPQSETRTAGNAPPEPAATAEMPDEVDRACDLLEWSGNVNAAAALRDAWRNHAQPVAVGMTEELEHVLSIAERDLRYKEECFDNSARTVHDERIERLRAAIAAVRQQAAQGRKVELGKVRELILWYAT